jgi:hypothetical protein
LSVALGHGDELFVELGVDFGSELLGRWHGTSLSTPILVDWNNKSR